MTSTLGTVILVAAGVLAAVMPVAAADPAPRSPLAPEPLTLARAADGVSVLPHQLVVKFHDAVRVRVEGNDGVVSRTGASLAGLETLRQRYDFTVESLIRLPAARLAGLEARAASRSGRGQPDLAGMLVLRPAVSNSVTLVRLGEALQQLESVEFVELMRLAPPPPGDIAPPTPDHTNLQGYRGPDPGLNVPPGAMGTGIRLSDCEYGWVYGHEDLVDLDLHPEPGQTIHPEVVTNGWDEHGTAALGSSAAAVNAYGATGIAPGATFYTYTEWSVEEGFRRVTAITNAIANSAPGDVVLLEMQASGAGGGFGPAELSLSVWTVVKAGIDAGVVVVGAAGNGDQDLDSAPYQAYRDRGDSGAILVGAGSATVAHNKLGFSTHGARVNVQAWGTSVFTLGYGGFAQYGGDKNQRYTSSFGGTSSASGLAAGAATLVQSAALDQLGAPLTPLALRQLLIDTGIPQGSGEHIGPAIDVGAAIAALATGTVFEDGFESGDTTAWDVTLP